MLRRVALGTFRGITISLLSTPGMVTFGGLLFWQGPQSKTRTTLIQTTMLAALGGPTGCPEGTITARAFMLSRLHLVVLFPDRLQGAIGSMRRINSKNWMLTDEFGGGQTATIILLSSAS